MEKFLAVAVKSVGPGGGTKLFLPPTQPTSPNFLSDAIRKTSTTKTGEKRPLGNFDHDDLDDNNNYEDNEDGAGLCLALATRELHRDVESRESTGGL